MFVYTVFICLVYFAPTCREGGNKRCFCLSVRPSVRPSVAYIANNSRTERPSVPKFGRKVPHLRCDSRTSFKVKTSKIKVTRPINADTHRVPYLPNAKAYELQPCRTTTRISHRRHDLQGQRSRLQGHVMSLSRLGPMLYLCH